MVVIEEVVPTINSLHKGFEGGFVSRAINACITLLLKSGPVCTYSTILYILSITIREEVDL